MWVNLKAFPFSVARRLPVRVDRRMRIGELHRGNVVLDAEHITRFMIQLGTPGVPGVSDERKGFLALGEKARLVFHGRACLTQGASIRSTKGRVEFGDNFYSNCNLSVICSREVAFGDNVLLGWDVCVRDCDGHRVYIDGAKTEGVRPVRIGDHVWLGAHTHILKGARIPNGSVVGYGSIVLGAFEEERILIAGYPAKKLRGNVDWEA